MHYRVVGAISIKLSLTKVSAGWGGALGKLLNNYIKCSMRPLRESSFTLIGRKNLLNQSFTPFNSLFTRIFVFFERKIFVGAKVSLYGL
jgi:hypothetical protein